MARPQYRGLKASATARRTAMLGPSMALLLLAGASLAVQSSSWQNLSRVIDPTGEPFHADPSGMTDSTAALAAAIE